MLDTNMILTDFFDKTFCINLERRGDRWEESIQEFKKYKLNFLSDLCFFFLI